MGLTTEGHGIQSISECSVIHDVSLELRKGTLRVRVRVRVRVSKRTRLTPSLHKQRGERGT